MERKLDGKVIVITGASSGFGKGTARKLAALGATVVLAARRETLLEDLALECVSLGGKAISVPTDVSQLADINNLFDKTMENFGQLDVWINNAGAAAIGKFNEVPISDHLQVIEANLCGTMCGSYVAMQEFVRQGFGTLINVASMIARIPAPYYAAYAASKHGVLGLSGALRQEMAEQKLDDIHVCTVLPMAMNTAFFEHAANYTGHESVPIPPLNEADDVVDVIVDLIFDPKAEVTVGKGSAVFSVIDSLAPGASEKMMGINTHKAQMVDAPPAAPTPGNLKHPTNQGSEVHGNFGSQK